MTSLHTLKTSTDAHTLWPTCLRHLDEEEAGLRGTLAALQEMRAALISRDPAALDAALKHELEQARRIQELHEQRFAFRTLLARTLDRPAEEITISQLIAALSPREADVLRDRCARLQRLADEVGQFNENNALLIFHALEFLGAFFEELTGEPSSRKTYGPGGRLKGAAATSFLEMRG